MRDLGEYATKFIDDEDNEKWKASDGKIYSTRSGAWKWSKRNETPKEEPKLENTKINEPIEKEENSYEWATFDYSTTEDTGQVIPSLLKKIKPLGAENRKKTKKELQAAEETSLAILGIGYRSADHLLTKYKKAVTRNPEAEAITHADNDYDWISSVSNEALKHSGLDISNALSPVQVAVICNTFWFGKPIVEIQSQAKRNPFKGAGKIFERLPFIGKRMKARREATELRREENERYVEQTLQA